MSTRAHIDFFEDYGAEGVNFGGIYRHSDGYPENMIPSLKRTLDAYRGAAQRSRGYKDRLSEIDLPDYAAWYILTEKPDHSKEQWSGGIGSIYLDHTMHGDEAYCYKVSAFDNELQIGIYRADRDKGFWDNPSWDACTLVAEGTLTELLAAYPMPKFHTTINGQPLAEEEE